MSQREELTDKEQMVTLILVLCAIVVIFIVVSSVFFPAVEYDEQCLSYRTYPIDEPCISTVNVYVPDSFFDDGEYKNITLTFEDSYTCISDPIVSIYEDDNVTEPVFDYVFDGHKTVNMLNLTWDLDDCIIDKDREE